MSLALTKRGKTYYAEGRMNGERVHESLKTRDIQVARALLRDLEMRLLTGGRLGSKTWKDFAGEFLAWAATRVKSGPESTLARYTFTVNRFSRFLEAAYIIELAHVDGAVMARYGEDRLQDVHAKTRKPATMQTVQSDFRILHLAFTYAVQAGYLQKNPVKWMKARRTEQTQPFSQDEVAAMLRDKCVVRQPWLKAIVLTFIFTGLRISDVVGLKREAVDFKAGRITTVTKKRGRAVSLALHPELRGAMELHGACLTEAQRESAYVFGKPDGTPLTRTGLTSTLMRVFNRCGIKGGHPHRFRDSFAVRILEQGGSLYDVARLLGIRVATAEQYYSPYCRELQERGARLVFGIRSTGDTSTAADEKVVTFRAPLSTAFSNFGEQQANEDEAVSAK